MDFYKWLKLEWDRVFSWVAVAGGVAALIVGWVGVSGNAYPAGQLPYVISGGVGGIFLLGLGAMTWISADLRDEWRKIDLLEKAINRAGLRAEPVPTDGGSDNN